MKDKIKLPKLKVSSYTQKGKIKIQHEDIISDIYETQHINLDKESTLYVKIEVCQHY